MKLVSIAPDEVYIAVAEDVAVFFSYTLISSKANSFVPVLNLIAGVLGIKNEPSIVPLASAIRADAVLG